MILGKGNYSRKNQLNNFVKLIKWILREFFLTLFKFKKDSVLKKSQRRNQGAPVLTTTPKGDLRCTSCMLCMEYCPTQCIHIIPDPLSGEESPPLEFDINLLKCIYCDLCSEVCPVDAIRTIGSFNRAGFSENEWIVGKDTLTTYCGEFQSEVGDDRPLLPL